MSRPVTKEEIEQFRLLYAKSGSYSQVARLTGRSMPTVRNHLKALEAEKENKRQA